MTPAESGARDVVLRLDRITRRFGATLANDAISLDVRRGEIVALVGENGAGKTTLMNILFGHYTADEGTVEVFGRTLPPGRPRAAIGAGVGMVHQHFTLADNLTVLDNILLGTEPLWRPGSGRAAARQRIEELSRTFGLAVDPSSRAGALTVGERQRVEILKALYRDARILILDEPTAVLAPQEAEALFATLRRMAGQGLAVIFISHKLHEVMGITDRCIVLRHGRVTGEVRTAEIDARRLAALMVGEELAEAAVPPGAEGEAVMRLEGVATPARGAAPGLEDVSLDLVAGRITGLAGVSGNGQADIADLVSGLLAPSSGRIELFGAPVAGWTPRRAVAAGIARIPEDRHKTGTVADFSLTENAVLECYADAGFARHGWMDWGAAERFAKRIVERYDVRCPGTGISARLLSGGNMQKLILGRVLERSPRIVLANQPVRGLDVGAISYVHGRIVAARDAGAAVLLISEDLDEIIALADVIHVISEGRLSPGFPRGSRTPAELGLWMTGRAGTEEGRGPGRGPEPGRGQDAA